MWLNETLASGLVPYYHMVGSEDGFGEDRRWQKVGADYFRWTAKHDAHFKVRRSVANIGVVMGQSTQLLYPGPATMHSRTYMRETTHGIYETLLAGRFAFDFVHEDRLDPDRLSKYRALLLPNIAMLSDRQCDQLQDYVRQGGSIMASFETGLYDEDLKPRADFALADLLGIGKAGDAIGTNGNAYYGRIERPHPILEGFADTNWIPGAQNRIPLKPVKDAVLTVVPGFVRYPPELAYPPVSHTNEPAVVLRETGSSRIAYFPGDIERTYWLTGHGDLLRLMHNTIRWITRDERVVERGGRGLCGDVCLGDRPRLCGAPAQLHQPQRTPRMDGLGLSARTAEGKPEASAGVRVKSVELLCAEQSVQFRIEDQVLRFTIPRVGDYEVAAITVG